MGHKIRILEKSSKVSKDCLFKSFSTNPTTPALTLENRSSSLLKRPGEQVEKSVITAGS